MCVCVVSVCSERCVVSVCSERACSERACSEHVCVRAWVRGWVGGCVCVVFRISVDCMYVCRVYCVYCMCVCVVRVDQ